IVGPSLGPAGKFENRNASFSTAGILQRAGLEVAITTDHDCQPLQFLPIFAALCVREGMEPDAALRAITINPARIIGIEDRVGSIELGKDADICIFSSHPFDLMAKTKAVFIDGQRIC
ncbi:amidohydrolase family protein, partial [Lutispora sp.]|uniref:amidohydrolase family protein n=1 Tax=Lutispora sp. TaxID=2828727 RepID=UPI002B20408C